MHPIVLLITLVCLASCLTNVTKTAHAQGILYAPTLQMFTRVSLFPSSKSPASQRISMQESYSATEKRFRIDIFNKNLLRYFGSDRLVVKVEKDTACAISETADFTARIFGQDLPINDWLKARPDIPDHIVGPLRVVFILRAVRDSWKRIDDLNPAISPIGVLRYSYSTTLDSGTRLEIKFSFVSAKAESAELPTEVEINLPDGRTFLLDFYHIKGTSSREAILHMAGINIMNVFSFPVGRGCGPVIKEKLGPLEVSTNRKYSFHAKIIDKTGAKANVNNFFFAHDDILRMARMDKYIQFDNPASGTRELHHLISMYDEREDKVYHIAKRVGVNDGSTEAKSEHTCVSSHTQTTRAQHEMLIPYEEMAELGVRFEGTTRIRVFEHVTDHPPILFFDHAEVSSSALETDYLRIVFFLRSVAKPSHPVTVVYMVRDELIGDSYRPEERSRLSSAALVRVLILSGGAAFIKIDVSQFAWYIQQAPNGDMRFQMFSLEDKCCNSPDACGVYRHAHLSALLEYKVDERLNQLKDVETALSMLPKSPLARNLDFVRAFVGTSGASATQINYATTKLFKEQERFLVEFDAHLSRPKIACFWTRMEGYTVGYLTDRVVVIDLPSSRDCYWYALRQRAILGQQLEPPSTLLFSYCSNKCVVDANAKYTTSERYWNHGELTTHGVWVTGFHLVSKESSCTVFRVDPLDDTRSTHTARRNWLNTYYILVNKFLHLYLTDTINSDGSNDWLLLKALRVELTSDRWRASEGHQGSAPEELDSSIAQSLRNTVSDVGLLSVDDGGSGELVSTPKSRGINLDRCHVACLASMTCNSYSLCETRTSRECMISRVSLRADNLLSSIDEAKSKHTFGEEIIAVKYKKPGGQSDEPETGPVEEEIKFKLHPRCQLYARDPLEMFATRLVYMSRILTKYSRPRWVENEQECASLCLARNMAYIRRRSRSSAKSTDAPSSAWCSSFNYIDQPLDEQDRITVEAISPNKSNQTGLCTLNKYGHKSSDLSDSTHNGIESTAIYRQSRFVFLYSNLYERQPETRMPALSNNVQVIYQYRDVQTCAMRCFLQAESIERCRSFDFVVPIKDPSSSRKLTFCIFNTMNLAEANAAPVLDNQSNSSSVELPPNSFVTHFEPYQVFDFSLGKTSDKIEPSHVSDQQMSGSGLPIVFAVLLAAVTGLSLGVLLYRRAEHYLASDARDTTSVPHHRFDHDLTILN